MFKPLTKDNIGSIVDLMIAGSEQASGRSGDHAGARSVAAKDYIIDGGYDPVYGARPLKRYLQKNVETLAAKLILSGKVGMEDEHRLYRKRRRADCRCEAEGRDRDCSERSLMACSSGRSRRRPRL